MHAAEELAVQDQRAADARGQRGVDQVVIAAARAQAMLGQRGDVGVVVHEHRHLQPLFQHLAHRLLVQRHQVRALQRHAAFEVHIGGKRRAHALQVGRRQARLLQQAAHLLGQVVHHFVGGAVLVGRVFQLRHQLHVAVKQPQLDVRAAHVDADYMIAHN